MSGCLIHQPYLLAFIPVVYSNRPDPIQSTTQHNRKEHRVVVDIKAHRICLHFYYKTNLPCLCMCPPTDPVQFDWIQPTASSGFVDFPAIYFGWLYGNRLNPIGPHNLIHGSSSSSERLVSTIIKLSLYLSAYGICQQTRRSSSIESNNTHEAGSDPPTPGVCAKITDWRLKTKE